MVYGEVTAVIRLSFKVDLMRFAESGAGRT